MIRMKTAKGYFGVEDDSAEPTDDSLPSFNFWRQLKSDADRGKSVIKGVPAVMMLRRVKVRVPAISPHPLVQGNARACGSAPVIIYRTYSSPN